MTFLFLSSFLFFTYLIDFVLKITIVLIVWLSIEPLTHINMAVRKQRRKALPISVLKLWGYILITAILSQFLNGLLVSFLAFFVLIAWGIRQHAPWKKILITTGLLVFITFLCDQLFELPTSYIIFSPLVFTPSSGVIHFADHFPHVFYALIRIPVSLPWDVFVFLSAAVPILFQSLLIILLGSKLWKFSGRLFYLFTFPIIVLLCMYLWNLMASLPCIGQKPVTQWMSCPYSQQLNQQ